MGARTDVVHKNAFPICAGLELSTTQGGEQTYGLNAELTFGREPLAGEGVSFRLGVKSGLLVVELNQCPVVSGTLFAVKDQPVTSSRQVAREQTESRSRKAGAVIESPLGLGSEGVTPIGDLAAAASGSIEATSTTSCREEVTAEVRRVTCRGTKGQPIWEIREPEGDALDGRYLGPENLCEIKVSGEEFRVIAEFGCRKFDLSLSEIDADFQWNPTRTKEKLALAVVAKELGRNDNDLDTITLCRSVLKAWREHEDGCVS